MKQILTLPLLQRIALSLISIIAIVYILHILQGILVPLCFGIVLSMMLYPIAKMLENRGLPRIFSIIVCLILVVILITIFLWLIINQFSILSAELPIYTSKVKVLLAGSQNFIENTFKISIGKLGQEIQKFGLELLKNSGAFITNFLQETTGILGKSVLVILYVFFFLYYRDLLRGFIQRLFWRESKVKVNIILGKIYEVVHHYLSGLLIVITIVAVLNSAGLLILGIDHAIFLGCFAAILLLIPYIGIGIGATIPTLIALLTKDSGWYAVAVLIMFFVVQSLESNFITPMVIGGKVNVNSFAAVVGLLLGGQLWGMAGLVLAMPIIAILKVIFDNTKSLKSFGYLLGDEI